MRSKRPKAAAGGAAADDDAPVASPRSRAGAVALAGAAEAAVGGGKAAGKAAAEPLKSRFEALTAKYTAALRSDAVVLNLSLTVTIGGKEINLERCSTTHSPEQLSPYLASRYTFQTPRRGAAAEAGDRI